MKKRIGHTLLALVWLVLFMQCNKSEENYLADNFPYSSEKIQLSNPIGDRLHLDIEPVLGNSVNLDGIFTSVYPPESIDLAKSEEGNLFIYLRSEEKLFQVDHDKNTHVIATAGNGPGSIQSGIRLIQSNQEPLFLQRNRVSSVECPDECALSVKHTLKEYYNYYNLMADGNLIVNGYSPFGESTIQLKDENQDLLKTFGESYWHENPSYVRHFNFTTIELSSDQRYLVHLFSDLPVVAVYDMETLEYVSFSITDFYPHQIVNSRNNTDEIQIDYQSRHSQFFNISQFDQDKFFVVVRHRRELESVARNILPSESYFFDYYILDAREGFDYIGSSTNILMPIGSMLVFQHNFELFVHEALPIDQLSAGTFNLPDQF